MSAATSIAAAVRAAVPGADVNAGPSHALAAQVRSGAPVDVLVSADRRWTTVDALGQDVLRRRVVARGTLVLAAGRRGASRGWSDVRRLAIGGGGVPVGDYAVEAMRTSGRWTNWAGADGLVRGGDAGTVAAYVARGEVDAGIVYATDAAAWRLTVLEPIDPATHRPIEYEAVQIDPRGADVFDRLVSADAAEVFRSAGFIIPG